MLSYPQTADAPTSIGPVALTGLASCRFDACSERVVLKISPICGERTVAGEATTTPIGTGSAEFTTGAGRACAWRDGSHVTLMDERRLNNVTCRMAIQPA